MATIPLATPELAAVEVGGMSRSAFLVRGALATGAPRTSCLLYTSDAADE